MERPEKRIAVVSHVTTVVIPLEFVFEGFLQIFGN